MYDYLSFLGSNSIIIIPGANNKLSVTDVEAAESVIKSAKVLVCQNEVPQDTSLRALNLASKHGGKWFKQTCLVMTVVSCAS